MNLSQLYYFKTVAYLEHYTRAAEKLRTTQPTISHAIADLQEEIGVDLFMKSGRNVKLTKHGKLYLKYVERALDALEEGRVMLQDSINPDSGTITLTYLSSLDAIIPRIIAHYYEDTGRTHVKFQFYQGPATQLQENLKLGIADIGFSTELPGPNYESFYLGIHRSVIIVSDRHPFANRSSISLEELRGERFIMYDHQCHIRNYIDQIFKDYKVNPKIVLETTHDNLVSSLVAENFGIALIPELLGKDKPQHIKFLDIEDPIPDRQIMLIWKKNHRLPPVTQRFLDYIHQNIQTLDFLPQKSYYQEHR